jgi:hypothetical protein
VIGVDQEKETQKEMLSKFGPLFLVWIPMFHVDNAGCTKPDSLIVKAKPIPIAYPYCCLKLSACVRWAESIQRMWQSFVRQDE